MTRNASRKKRTREAAAGAGGSYTQALRRIEGSSNSRRAPQLLLGTFVAEEEPAQGDVVWAPSRENSRLVIDGTHCASLLTEMAVLQAAHHASLPTLAIGAWPEEYREAAPHAQVIGMGNDPEGGGYHEASRAVDALTAFIYSRHDWRLLLVHVQQPVEDEDGQKGWETSPGQIQRLSSPDRRALRDVHRLISDAGTRAIWHPGLLMAGVITDDLNDASLFHPESFTTTLSAALHLEYERPVTFDTRLPYLDEYLPRWRNVIEKLDVRREEPFWGGMNPKAGRIVLGSINGSNAHTLLLPDPPFAWERPSYGWSMTRNSILEMDLKGRTR